MKSTLWQSVALAVILIVAAAFRFYGLLWDGGYLFHPDERKIVLVASGLGLPSSLGEALSPQSPLSPQFFAYGSFPIYLLRALSAFAPAGAYSVPDRQDQFVALGILGRELSALFDLASIVLTFFLGRRLYNATVGLIAAACIAVTVLHIQLSHFYAVDTVLTCLVLATLLFAARYADTRRRLDLVLMGVAFGLALATKITAAPLVLAITLAVVRAHGLTWATPSDTNAGDLKRRVLNVVRAWGATVWSTRRTLARVFGLALLVMVVTQPYVLLDPVLYFGQTGTELLVARGWADFPYTRQYANTIPFVYHIVQSTIWGMGLPLGLFAWGGFALFILHWWRTREWQAGLLLAWGLVYFLSVGGQFAKYLRYLLPMLPVMYLMAASAIARTKPQAISHKPKKENPNPKPSQRDPLRGQNPNRKSRLPRATFHLPFTTYYLLTIALLSALAYAFAFTSIYSREHPWPQISEWIYRNVPPQATLAEEHWDDQLPMPVVIGNDTRRAGEYRINVLPMYDADDETKLSTLVDTLVASDYIVLASRRLYATIPRIPARYPMSTRYYRLLFGGQLGFEPVAFAENDPMLGGTIITNDTFAESGLEVPAMVSAELPGVRRWDWGRADESFTVYDHPLPLVFKKTRALSPAELRGLLATP